MSHYTPTTRDMRRRYITNSYETNPSEVLEAEFDRWLTSERHLEREAIVGWLEKQATGTGSGSWWSAFYYAAEEIRNGEHTKDA